MPTHTGATTDSDKGSAPFDTSLPSPIGRLLELRASSTESVVRQSGLSPVQHLMSRPGTLEDNLWDLCDSDQAPDLILLTGSAGSGKTATIGHLTAKDAANGGGRFGTVMADATHADSPNEEQAARLSAFFAPFADDADRPGGPCRMIAINTGMVMKFFNDTARRTPHHQLYELEQLLTYRLALPGAPDGAPSTWRNEAVLAVNLDLRPTSGQPGDLFDLILTRLDPTDPAGVLEGAPRCATCQVVQWCWPMANAATISGTTGRTAVNRAAGTVSMRRGRELAPRALWDAAANLVLSGLNPATGADPCDAVADVAQAADRDTQLLDGLACHRALESPAEGGLNVAVAAADPTYRPSRHTHERLSTAGLSPIEDAHHLLTWLAGDNQDPHPALQHATHLVATRAAAQHPRAFARAAWLGADIAETDEANGVFGRALTAQAAGATADTTGSQGDAILEALAEFSEGLADGFGVRSGVETFYPTEAPGPRDTDVYVRADLLDGGTLWTAEGGDPNRKRNPTGATLVGYRELALALRIGPVPVEVDYPLWDLLQQARYGTSPSTVDLERYLSLRRAIEAIGREAGSDHRLPLLVLHRTTGRRYRVSPYGPTNLRATEVE